MKKANSQSTPFAMIDAAVCADNRPSTNAIRVAVHNSILPNSIPHWQPFGVELEYIEYYEGSVKCKRNKTIATFREGEKDGRWRLMVEYDDHRTHRIWEFISIPCAPTQSGIVKFIESFIRARDFASYRGWGNPREYVGMHINLSMPKTNGCIKKQQHDTAFRYLNASAAIINAAGRTRMNVCTRNITKYNAKNPHSLLCSKCRQLATHKHYMEYRIPPTPDTVTDLIGWLCLLQEIHRDYHRVGRYLFSVPVRKWAAQKERQNRIKNLVWVDKHPSIISQHKEHYVPRTHPSHF